MKLYQNHYINLKYLPRSYKYKKKFRILVPQKEFKIISKIIIMFLKDIFLILNKNELLNRMCNVKINNKFEHKIYTILLNLLYIVLDREEKISNRIAKREAKYFIQMLRQMTKNDRVFISYLLTVNSLDDENYYYVIIKKNQKTYTIEFNYNLAPYMFSK